MAIRFTGSGLAPRAGLPFHAVGDYAGGFARHTILRRWRACLKISFVHAAVCLMAVMSAGILHAAAPPVSLSHLGFKSSKLVKAHWFSLKLTNHRPEPVYYLLPCFGDVPLSEKARLTDGRRLESELCKVLREARRESVAIGVDFGATFTAFRLPAQSECEISKYLIYAVKPFDDITVVEARDLLVNGKCPLENWLPFRIGLYGRKDLSADEIRELDLVGSMGGFQNNEVVSQEKVEFIEPKGIQRWTIKFDPKGELPKWAD